MHALIESGFGQLLKASWQGAVLILIVLALQRMLGHRLEPRWRHALWLLVLARLALPWTVPSPVSVFNLFSFTSLSNSAQSMAAPGALSIAPPTEAGMAAPGMTAPIGGSDRAPGWNWIGVRSLLPLLWGAGALLLALRVAVGHYRFHRKVVRSRSFVDERALNLLEDCKTTMRIRTPISLIETPAVDGPSLFGFLRPRLLLPTGFTRNFSAEELRFVFLHELGHVKRHDIPLGWLMSLLQVLHWFNPLVWLAFSRTRVDRELACDAVALAHADVREAKPYGRTILKLLEGFGDSVRGPGLAGIIEDKQEMQQRILMITQFDKPRRRFGLAGTLFVGLALVALTDAQLGCKSPAAAQRNESGPISSQEQQHIKLAEGGNQWAAFWLWDAYAHGNNGVTPDPIKADKWLRTFVQNVWIVRFEPVGDYHPTTPGEFLAQIERYAHSYSGQTELGENGFFRTTKQDDKLVASFLSDYPDRLKASLAKVPGIKVTSTEKITPQAFVRYNDLPQESLSASSSKVAPRIVSTMPAIGATEVDPAMSEITVTFDQDMGGGFSWTGGGPEYPPTIEGRRPEWRQKRTCALPVKLEPGHFYRVGINSTSYRSFASEAGVPALPSAIFFTTKGADEQLKAKTLTPRVVRLEPDNGAQNVSPDLEEVRVTFNVPMGGGFSWCTAGDDDSDFPKGREGKRARWTEDKKCCVLPVALKPGMTYRMSLNAEGYKNFQSDGGVPLEPVAYTFTTSGKP